MFKVCIYKCYNYLLTCSLTSNESIREKEIPLPLHVSQLLFFFTKFYFFYHWLFRKVTFSFTTYYGWRHVYLQNFYQIWEKPISNFIHISGGKCQDISISLELTCQSFLLCPQLPFEMHFLSLHSVISKHHWLKYWFLGDRGCKAIIFLGSRHWFTGRREN